MGPKLKYFNRDSTKLTLIFLAFPALLITGIYLRKHTSDFWYNLFF